MQQPQDYYNYNVAGMEPAKVTTGEVKVATEPKFFDSLNPKYWGRGDAALARREARDTIKETRLDAKTGIAEAKSDLKVRTVEAHANAQVSAIEAGAKARIAGMEAREISGLKGRYNYLKGYHGGGLLGSSKAGIQASFEGIAKTRPISYTKAAVKWGAIAGVGALALSFLASSFRKPESLGRDDSMLSPGEMGDMASVMPDNAMGPALPPLDLTQGKGSNYWRDVVSGNSPEQLAKTSIPRIAEDGGFDDVGVPARGA